MCECHVGTGSVFHSAVLWTRAFKIKPNHRVVSNMERINITILCGKPPSLLFFSPKSKTMGCYTLQLFQHFFFGRVPQNVLGRRDKSVGKLLLQKTLIQKNSELYMP